MTSAVTPGTVAALAPVRDALVAEARADAARLVADAANERQARETRARGQSAALLAQARADGEAEAERELAAERTTARRRARAIVLTAQREAYEALLQSVSERVSRIAAEPHYPELVERLSAVARHQLGPHTRVLAGEGGRPGVVGEVDGRRVDYTLESLAEEALKDLGPDVEALWT
jgi:vacuolar-type H+-ATPase subunit E/Vma4